ncbi:MAG: hypothetical protein MJY61_04315, partial [Bacteroidales bacterium]|nr:hypothetical protein [Bacteroidales bacterium]
LWEALYPDYTLPGIFSVGANKKVKFSKGNLCYVVNGAKWRMYEHQYDFCNTTTYAGHHSDTVSLFTWGYDATKSIIPDGQTGDNVSRISGNLTQTEDWGCKIGDGNTWRTLSDVEWEYLIADTTRMVNDKPCWSSPAGGVTIGGKTYHGLFLYPDDYDGDVVSSSMSWDDINAAGIVFLPAAGWRMSNSITGIDDEFGSYWSSTATDDYFAFGECFYCGDTPYGSTDCPRDEGNSVRLVTVVEQGSGQDEY